MTGSRAAPVSDSFAVPTDIVNALTIDVDDYFQDFAVAAHVSRASWDDLPSRVEPNVERLLGLLSDHDARATFFTLGWVAERYPQLIRRIVDGGHELASHGYENVRASEQTYGQFLADIRLAKAVLEDISGIRVLGYRAPNFSIGPANYSAFDCILEAGYRYSSSIYPIRHNSYGGPDVPRFAHEVRPGLLEVPAATIRAYRVNWPGGGGEYFRLLPYELSRWSIRRINVAERQPAMFHFHPWELDPEQPQFRGPGPYSRLRHFANRKLMEPRLHRLLDDFRWDRADRTFLAGLH